MGRSRGDSLEGGLWAGFRLPRAVWGINLLQMVESMAYFGVLGLMAQYLTEVLFRGQEGHESEVHSLITLLTMGVGLYAAVFGFVADKLKMRVALVLCLFLLLAGRFALGAAPGVAMGGGDGFLAGRYPLIQAGLLIAAVGTGIFNTLIYGSVKRLVPAAKVAMACALLYGLLNLGGWLPWPLDQLRQEWGLATSTVLWFYTSITCLVLLYVLVSLLRKGQGNTEPPQIGSREVGAGEPPPLDLTAIEEADPTVPVHLWFGLGLVGVLPFFLFTGWVSPLVSLSLVILGLFLFAWPAGIRWVRRRPAANLRFLLFIVAFMPVSTLFTYNWLILPQFITRTSPTLDPGFLESLSNLNPLLITVLAPLGVLVTRKARTYTVILWGTSIMAVSAFLFCLGSTPGILVAYTLLVTLGEALWYPRFYQFILQMAPRERVCEYVGLSCIPWLLTKFLGPRFYSGWAMDTWCPAQGETHAGIMWFLFGLLALVTPVVLMVGRKWLDRTGRNTMGNGVIDVFD